MKIKLAKYFFIFCIILFGAYIGYLFMYAILKTIYQYG